MSSKLQTRVSFFSAAMLILALLSACAGTPNPGPVVSTVATQVTGATEPAINPPVPQPAGSGSEIIVYTSDLSQSALSELGFLDDSASPGGKLIGLPNSGEELDPPPENDPHLTFTVQVQSGLPYRCWIHMKVGTPRGVSNANVIWVQFSGSVDQANNATLRTGTNSYLTAQGPQQTGWTWVGCNADSGDSLVYFKDSGEVTVRIQAGAEGVGFDQFLLSSSQFLKTPPSDPVVMK